MSVEAALDEHGWHAVHRLSQPPKSAEYIDVTGLDLCDQSTALLKSAAPSGIYNHQAEAIALSKSGANVCITTGTASGKSLAFQISAIEMLAGEGDRRVLAVYPLKALGREQRDRWETALNTVGIEGTVAVIDGSVPTAERLSILRTARVLVVTPDILHAWMLFRLSEPNVRNFLRLTSLVVVDEVHNYAGVFGSNAAFLFRRLQHAMELLGSSPQYFCASATLDDPRRHLLSLFGLDFSIVGPDRDSSPRQALRIWLVERPGSGDLLSELSTFLIGLASTGSRFLAFVDSRKLTEHIASIAARSHDPDDDDDDTDAGLAFDHLKTLDILPYRAGYEERDRSAIQRRLARGGLAGVVSTSALELGIDIPYLDAGVLVGVPRSSTSLVQRIGRIGRHSEGDVIIVNTGTIYDEAIFNDPESLLNRPAAESALYLENERIQYIHALCLARLGGEHDQLCQGLRLEETQFQSAVAWPDGFMSLCERERVGEITGELFAMKAEAGESPNHTFPLRDVEASFSVLTKRGPDVNSLGSLSYSQVMREAYPGAVYYYITKPFRVIKVSSSSREIHVRRERRYSTQPQFLPTLVFPNLSPEAVTSGHTSADLTILDCSLQIRESIIGFKERRGSTEFASMFPLDHTKTGVYFPQQRFSRNFFTTGAIIAHPALDVEGVNAQQLAELVYEAFLIAVPFERQDIAFACDKFRADRGPLTEGRRFIAIYDQTYGSLHLSGRLLEPSILSQTLDGALSLVETTSAMDLSSATVKALESLAEAGHADARAWTHPGEIPDGSDDDGVLVIRPGSRGLAILHDNEEFEVAGVFYNPALSSVAYRGRLASTARESVKNVLAISNVVPIPGESEMAIFDVNTGELTSID